MASQTNVTVYAGVTNDLIRRVWEHKNEHVESMNPTWEDLYPSLL